MIMVLTFENVPQLVFAGAMLMQVLQRRMCSLPEDIVFSLCKRENTVREHILLCMLLQRRMCSFTEENMFYYIECVLLI